MMKTALFSALPVLCVATSTFAQIVSYDATSSVFPEAQGWEYITFCTPTRWFETGFLHEDVDVGECGPPPGGDTDHYRLPIDEFIGVDEFFVEWRMSTTATEPWGGSPGAVLTAWNQGGEQWWFGFTRDEIKFFQDNFVVNEYFNIESDVPHTYRLEIFGESSYTIFIDGDVAWEGIPGGPFLSFNPNVAWTTRAWTMDSETQWAYVRYGVIPVDSSGDFNSDGQVNENDAYYFQECLETEAGNWAGCAWADFSDDGDVDCGDGLQFQLAWTGAGDPPTFEGCTAVFCQEDLNGDNSVNAADLALLLGAWGPNPGHAADFNGDTTVDAADLAPLLGAWGPCEL